VCENESDYQAAQEKLKHFLTEAYMLTARCSFSIALSFIAHTHVCSLTRPPNVGNQPFKEPKHACECLLSSW
jgi:hypothetical protein